MACKPSPTSIRLRRVLTCSKTSARSKLQVSCLPRLSLSNAYSTQSFKKPTSSQPDWKFITAASFVGKPDLGTTSPSPITNTSPVYQQWVETQKRVWYDRFVSRYSPNRTPPPFSQLTHSGHDWWFVDQASESGIVTLGVADGVGGWESEDGINPAEVAQGLMYYASKSYHLNPHHHPVQIITQAYRDIMSDRTIEGGSSTALIARLDPQTPSVHWANLGDSALLILRDKGTKILVTTQAQTHYFNCPFQLTKFPSWMGKEQVDLSVLDQPEKASVGMQNLEDGDIILLFTDGMGDNLWHQEMSDLVNTLIGRDVQDEQLMEDLVHTLCSHARLDSFKTNKVTPFEADARRHGVHDMQGGKVDDITLVAALCRRQDR